jgi:RND family efflux transporter MFP subunit
MKVFWISAAAAILAACGSKAEKPAAPPPPSVEAANVDFGSTNTSLIASGILERRREMTLSFRIGGVLTDLSVDAGDVIAKGQILAAIDPTGVEARSRQVGADLERARRDLSRDQKLFDQGFVSRARLDDRASAVKSAQAAFDSAGFDRRWARLAAPAGGVVLSRQAQKGEVVQPGQAVVRIADQSSPLVLRLSVADRDVARVRLGQSADIRFDALPGQALTGQVVKIGQAADSRTGAVEVEVELPAAPDLRSGLVATAKLAVMDPDAGLFARIPAEAILEAEGKRASVLRLVSNRAVRTEVGFGGFDGDFAKVSGLPPGSRVITAGAGFVSNGDTVRVADAATLAGAAR